MRTGRLALSATLLAAAFTSVMGASAPAATRSTLGATGSGPTGITLDSSGNVFTANKLGGTVTKLTPAGTGATPFGGGAVGLDPVSLVTDSAGNVYVVNANGASNSVSRVTADGVLSAPFVTLPAGPASVPHGITIGEDGTLFTANANTSAVSKISSAGSLATSPWPVSVGTTPYAITSDRDGNLYTANYSADSVTKVTPGGVASAFGSVGNEPYALVTDDTGNVFTTNYNTGGFGVPGSVSKVNPDGTTAGSPWPVSLGNGAGPQAVTIDSSRNLYVANVGAGSVSKITPSGTSSLVLSGSNPSQAISSPSGITIDADGNLYVTGYNANNVYKVTPDAAGEISPAPPARPVAPTAVAGDGTATVTVTPNAADKRFGVPSSYAVSAVQDPSKSCTVTPPATSCEIAGLTNGTAYTFVARANLNLWQTGGSDASSAVTPIAPPAPNPDPTPAAVVKVSALKAKVSRKSAYLTSRVTVNVPGKIFQAGTTSRTTGKGSKRKTKVTTRCRATVTAPKADTYTVKCNLGSKGRKALRKASLKLTVKTTITPTNGTAASASRKITVKRKR